MEGSVLGDRARGRGDKLPGWGAMGWRVPGDSDRTTEGPGGERSRQDRQGHGFGAPGETCGLRLGPLSPSFAAQPGCPLLLTLLASVVSSVAMTSLCPGHPHQSPSWQHPWS